MLDILITNGQVVDGTGTARRSADVGIRDGRVVVVGDADELARRTIDADGQIVAPGFIDIHTHYDAQAFWDPTLSPSPLHGVTTVVAGNCGFSIAPISAGSAEYMMKMLARVEGMPLSALQAGVPWDWSSTAEFLDRLDGALAINAGFMVGHSAIRRMVMGEDAVGEKASSEQIERMGGLLRAGLRAGGLGFSSSLGYAHQDADGNPVPSRHADVAELLALAEVCRAFDGTSLELIPAVISGDDFSEADRWILTEMSARARRPVNWNLMRVNAASLERDRRKLATARGGDTIGAKVIALAMPIEFPNRYRFLTPFGLDGLPGWAKPMALPVNARLQLLGDPARRNELEELAQRDPNLRHISDWESKLITETFAPETKHYEGRLVGDIAAEEGKSPFDALLDIVCADELRTTFCRVPPPDTDEDWAARREIWRDEGTVIGASDAGAHLDSLATFNYPTYMLGRVVREVGALSLEETVAMLTAAPADLYGMRGRGRLVEGASADVVIFDESTVASEPVETRFDLPGGAGRLYAGAIGIDRVVVNGVEIVEQGHFSEDRPGALLRSGRDTGGTGTKAVSLG